MEIKIQYRQTGKSYNIAQILKKDKNSLVLVANEAMRKNFIGSFDVNKNQVMIFSSFIKEGRFYNSKLKIYIDEVGHCVQSLFKQHVIYGTHT